MEKILIVPDIHGRTFWEPALNYPGQVIFLGDYTDPYPQEGFKDEDAWQVLLKVTQFKRENPERVTLLAGNHELHYYDRSFEAGRFSERYYDRFHKLLTEDAADCFQLCKQVDKYLFIHAGIVKVWYETHLEEIQKLGDTLEERLNKLFRTNPRAFYEASYHRGGWSEAGSPLWADIHELQEEKEDGHFDNNLMQIIGHTQLLVDDPLEGDKFRMLDNKRLYILENDQLSSKFD
jgi:hypothetical protein